MKHILPILTLTTLAAAASAQSAAAAGLSYNRAGLSYNTDAATGNGYSASIEALVGSSNVWVGASAGLDTVGEDGVSVGYLFKNVIGGIDATAFVGSNDGYGIIARRSLNEVVAGLEGRIVWGQEGGSNDNSFVYELAYNVNSKYQVAVSIADANGVAEETSVTVRYNF
jgi:hypothetical protein